MNRWHLAVLATLVAGCSSTSGTGSTTQTDSGAAPAADSGGGGTADAGGSLDGGFDFTFTNSGANITRKDLKAAPVMGSFCMAAGGTDRTCSFTGSVTDSATGCTGILNVAFVGPLVAGGSFPIVADLPTAPGKGEVSYTESCAAGSRRWQASSGTVTLDAVTPPAAGLATGTASFSVKTAFLEVAKASAGDAQGTFAASGKGMNVTFTAP